MHTKTSIKPRRSETLREKVFRGQLPNKVLSLITKRLSDTKQTGCLAAMCRVSKSTLKLVTPVLYHTVRLHTAEAIDLFFSYFDGICKTSATLNPSNPQDRKVIGDYGHDVVSLPKLVRHLDIIIDTGYSQCSFPSFHTHDVYDQPDEVSPSSHLLQPLFRDMESLHILTREHEPPSIRRSVRRYAEFSPPPNSGLLLQVVLAIFRRTMPAHARWITCLAPCTASHMWLIPQGGLPEDQVTRSRTKSLDMPFSILKRSSIGRHVIDPRWLSYWNDPETVSSMISGLIPDSNQHDRNLPSVPILKETIKTPESDGRPTLFIIESDQEKRQEISACLIRKYHPVRTSELYRLVFLEQAPFSFDSGDEWREWPKKDFWGTEYGSKDANSAAVTASAAENDGGNS